MLTLQALSWELDQWTWEMSSDQWNYIQIHIYIYIKRNFEKKFKNFEVSIVPACGLLY